MIKNTRRRSLCKPLEIEFNNNFFLCKLLRAVTPLLKKHGKTRRLTILIPIDHLNTSCDFCCVYSTIITPKTAPANLQSRKKTIGLEDAK